MNDEQSTSSMVTAKMETTHASPKCKFGSRYTVRGSPNGSNSFLFFFIMMLRSLAYCVVCCCLEARFSSSAKAEQEVSYSMHNG